MPSLNNVLKPNKLRLSYHPRVCPCCRGDLRYSHQSSGRGIFRLTKWLHVVSQVVYCTNSECEIFKELLHPPEELKLAPPGVRVGNDVWAEIGRLHFGKKMTHSMIRTRLEEEHGFVISEREIENLAELFGALMSGAHLDDAELIKELKKAGRMVLSIDAAKPLKDDDLVWFIRDVLSGNTLAAKTLRSSTATDLRAFLRPVKEFAEQHGIAILGVISDGEKNIRKAIAKELRGIPHQLCQLHFVKNIAKPLQAKDSSLRKMLKNGVKGLRKFEREVAAEAESGGISKKQAEILQNISLTLQSILKDSGKPPFQPAGLKLYARLEELREELQQMKMGPGGQFVTDLLNLLRVLDDTRGQRQWLLLYYEDILQLGKILFEKGQTTAGAKRLMKELETKWRSELAELEKVEKKDQEDKETEELLRGWLDLLASYGPDLYHTFGNPYIPATNNGMEKFIGDLKKLEQVLSNNPRPATRFVKHAPVRALAFARKQLPGETFLASRRPEELRQAKAFLETRRKRASIGYKARRNFKGTVDSLRKLWNEDSGATELQESKKPSGISTP